MSTDKRKKPEELRSHRWLGVRDLRAFGHRSRLMQIGYGREDWAGKPVIGIVNTWSDINPCHAHFRTRAEEVKRGIWQAGGFPLELPAISLSEPFVKPTTMLYRNFLAMETEELIRSHPIDGVVLMGGCDKTTPGLIMGALSAGVPAIFFPAGPMLRGNWHGEPLGSGSDSWKYWAELRAGNINEREWQEVEEGIARSFGHCMTMGTASTMTAIAETMGFVLPGGSAIPAPDANHPRARDHDRPAGRRDGVGGPDTRSGADRRRRGQRYSRASRHGRLDQRHDPRGGDGAARRHPARSRAVRRAGARGAGAGQRPPSGKYLMEDFYYAGGILALQGQLRELLDLDCLTVNGRTIGQNIEGAKVYNDDVIKGLNDPVAKEACAILKGNLAPDGCVIKPSAAEPRLLKHRGPAVVFEDYNDMAARIDSDDLEVTADHILVLKNAGPVGGPGMPEWGMLPIPKKLLKQGVRDMLRLSDARMSGTSYGACILHVSPEAAVGGPLALVRTGDIIEVDVDARRLDLAVPAEELDRRRAAWKPKPAPARGYGRMFAAHIAQAHEGCDFDFLTGTEPLPEPEIH